MSCMNPLCKCADADQDGFCSDRCRGHGTDAVAGESCDCGHRACTGEDAPIAE